MNRNGEDEVLRWLAPKARRGASPIQVAVREVPSLWRQGDLSCHSSESLGIAPEKFAYFALSLVWRAAAHDWSLPDGTRVARLDLGDFYEPVRAYLLGAVEFPTDTFLTAAVCTDPEAQEYWTPPLRSTDLPALIVVPVLGFLFRVWFGRHVPTPLLRTLFYPSEKRPVFSLKCWDVLGPSFRHAFPVP